MASSGRILALVNKHLPGICVYDADSHELLHRVPVETIAPHELAISSDGRSIYVPIYGSSGVGKPGTDEHTLHIFNSRTGKQQGVLDMLPFKRLHSIVVGRYGKMYVTAETSQAVVIIDLQSMAVEGSIPTGSTNAHMIAVTADERTIFSSNVWSETISVMDVTSRSLTKMIPTEGPNQRITLSPDEGHVVTSLISAQKVVALSRHTFQLEYEVQLDGSPFTAKFGADGAVLYNIGTRHGETCVWKIDVAGRQAAKAVYGLGGDPGSLEVSPFTGNIYVTDQPTRKLMILDPDSLALIKSIETDPSPDAMAFGTIL